MNQCGCKTCGYKTREAHANGQGIWLYKRPIRHKILRFLLLPATSLCWCMRLEALLAIDQPLQRIKTQSSADSLPFRRSQVASVFSAATVSRSPAAIWRMLERALKEQIDQRCCNCRAITVACAGLPLHTADGHGSVFYAWAPPTLKLESHRHNVLFVRIWVSPLYVLG